MPPPGYALKDVTQIDVNVPQGNKTNHELSMSKFFFRGWVEGEGK